MAKSNGRRYLREHAIDAAQLSQRMERGEFSSVYLFYGKETYLKEQALAALRARLLPAGLEDLNDITLEAPPASQILDAAQTLPFMADRRVVAVRDWAPFYSGNAKNEEGDVARITEWLAAPPDTCSVVFYLRNEPEEKKKIVKAFMDAEAAGSCTIVRFDYLQGRDMLRWVNGYLKGAGKRISQEACDLITDMAGNELNRVRGELDKLIAFTQDRREITYEDVDEVVAPSLEYITFRLVDVMLSGDLRACEEMTAALLRGGEKAAGLLSLITAQLRRYMLLREGREAPADMDTVARWMSEGGSPYQLKLMYDRCKAISVERLKHYFDLSVQAEFAVKSGRLREGDALHGLIHDIATDSAVSSSKRR